MVAVTEQFNNTLGQGNTIIDIIPESPVDAFNNSNFELEAI